MVIVGSGICQFSPHGKIELAKTLSRLPPASLKVEHVLNFGLPTQPSEMGPVDGAVIWNPLPPAGEDSSQ